MENAPEQASRLLANLNATNRPETMNQLVPLVYDELRRLAHRYFRDERPDHTLQPTALVHEAYLRLVGQTRISWQDRTHFLAVCAREMRRVLIDYARGRAREKRGGGQRPLSLDSELVPADLDAQSLLDVNAAVEDLAQLDARQAHIVELRFFGGMTVDEVAEVTGLAKRTVEGEWTHAKAWLRAQLGTEGPA